MKFVSNNILITGGAGFIGSNFINYILEKYNETNIINLDLLTYAGDLNNLEIVDNDNYTFIKGDISDSKLVQDIFIKYKIDGVINFAAETHVDNSIKNPDVFIKTNINGTFNLINVAYNNWMNGPFDIKSSFRHARFHQISTDEVYGSISKGNFNETSNYAPNSPYSASKAAGDMLVKSFNKTYGMNISISLSSNNFGINQNNEKFIPKVIMHLIKNQPIPIYGNGLNVRDWIHVDDHCKAIENIYINSKSGESYNIGGENEVTNIELVNIIYKLIKNYIDIEKKISFIEDRHGHDFRYSLDTTKIKNNFNWKPSHQFELNLQTLIEFYLNQYKL